MAEPKFAYEDKVRVVQGFYRGHTGFVCHVSYGWFFISERYLAYIAGKITPMWFYAHQLELLPKEAEKK